MQSVPPKLRLRLPVQQLSAVQNFAKSRISPLESGRLRQHLQTAAKPTSKLEEVEKGENEAGRADSDLKPGALDSEPSGLGVRASSSLPSASELTIFLVAAFWGTNPVCLRYIYLLDEAPSPAALAAFQSAGAALLLAAASFWRSRSESSSKEAAESTASFKKEEGLAGAEQHGLNELLSPVAQAGLETGVWTFLANSATISAFQHTPASRGAFLIRLTAVFTPAVAKLSGQYVSSSEWTACGMALAGGLLISLDSLLASSNSSAKDATLGLGDAVMVISACLWAVQTVRVGHHAKQHDQLQLASSQTGTFALLSAAWLAGLTLWEGPHHNATGSLFSSGTSPSVWAAVLWPAIGPWGIATALQLRAQRVVSAPKTQIIMATDPLWASLFARVLGSAEQSLGLVGWAGAAGILAASAVARH